MSSLATPSNPEHRRVLAAMADRLIADGHPARVALRLAYESLMRVELSKQRPKNQR